METQKSLREVVDGWASIKHVAFEVVIGIFYGLALLSVLARAAARLVQRRRLSLDDYFLFAAALFLSGTIGLTYILSDQIYLWMALRKENMLFLRLDPSEVYDMLNTAMIKVDMFLTLVWTAIFLVKGSFLAFFKQLIWQVSMIQKYYWAVVAITLVSWMFLLAEPFILCSDFGVESIKCFDESKNLLYVVMTGLITGLDCLTDILIVSIPVILLGRSSLRFSQKVILGTFMSLSLVMVVIAIVRGSKVYGVNGVDLPWEFFWQIMEANVAVLMGSLTVFRTLLTNESKKRAEERRRAKAAGPRSQHPRSLLSLRMWRLLHIKGGSRLHSDLESQDGRLPEIPSGTITGMRTFIWRDNREAGDSILDSRQTETLAGDDESYLMQKESNSVQLEKPRRAAAGVHVHHDSVTFNPNWYPDWTQPSMDGTTLGRTGSKPGESRN